MNKIEFVYRIARFGFLLALGVLALTCIVRNRSSGQNRRPFESKRSRDRHNFAKTAGQGSDSCCVSDFRRRGSHRFLRAVGSFSGRHDSRAAEKCRSVCTPWPKRRNRSAPAAECRSFPITRFENAPAPKVIVIPAQSAPSPAILEWIRKSSKTTDVTMSVCTGAFVLAKTGLLNGKAATTYHGAFGRFAMQFPDIQLKRGARFVENGNLATAGGLSSGIDLALRVVERYYGREVAQEDRLRHGISGTRLDESGLKSDLRHRHLFQPLSIRFVRSAEWMSIQRSRRNLF